MTQLALPEQSLSRFNLIIAPTLTLSHKSTAAGDCCSCRLCAQWVIIATVPFHGQNRWMPQRIFIIVVWTFQTDGITSAQCFFLSSIPIS